ncbi:MAG: PAS domain S-box protein [Bacteroidales bacterium]
MEANYKQLIKNAPFGYALHKIILNDKGNPIDYQFIDVNTSFEKLTGLKAEQIINKTVTEVIPGITQEDFDWIACYGEIAINGGEKEFEQYSAPLDRWYKVQVNSSEKFYFTTFFTDISPEIQLINLSKQFLDQKNSEIDYQQIIDGMQALSGAKYLSFNLFDENGRDFTTVAIAGIKEHIQKATELIGYKLIGKKWKFDPLRAEKIQGKNITRYKSLQELTANIISSPIIAILEKTFKLGEVAIVKIMKADISLGDFTIVMSKGESLRNDLLVEIFAQQLGLYLDRKKVEKSLLESEEKLRNLIKDMQVGVLLQGSKAEIIMSNPKALEFLGISEEQLLGKTSFDPDWNVIHEDGTPFPGALHPVPQSIALRQPIRNVIMGVFRPLLNDRVWLMVDAEPQFYTDGSVKQVVCSFIDITKRKMAEQALRDSEEKYRILLENSGIGVGVFNLDGKIQLFNQKALEHLGGKAEDFIGKSLQQVFGEDAASEYLRRFKEVLKADKNLEYEDFVSLASGDHYFISNYTSIKNTNAEIVGIQVLSHEITERKLIEKALEETNTYLENLLNYANAPIIVWDSQLRITRFNHAFENLSGRSEEEVLGKPIDILFPPKKLKISMDLIRKASTGERWETVEIEILNKDTTVRTLLWNSATLFTPNDHSPIATIAQGQDITERKKAELILLESELNYRTLFKTSPSGILKLDENGIILEANEAFLKTSLYTLEELIGSNVRILTSPEYTYIVDENIHRLFNGETLEEEVLSRRKDGSYRILLLRENAITLPNGRKGILSVSTDITERKQAEEKIILQNTELQNLNATKDKFFSIIAHDLRSPFNSFLGLTQIIAEELNSLTMDQLQKFAESMRKSATNLFRLLENLLEWAQLQQGNIPFNPDRFNLLSLAKESIEMVVETAQTKQIEIFYDIPSDLEVFADSNIVQTIIRNIVSNSVKFTSKGGHILISAIINPEKDIQISIADSGIGMDNILMANLFNLGVNTSRKGTEGELSSGLGLILCKEFVEKHGGKLWVESEKGKGSCFIFTLKNA